MGRPASLPSGTALEVPDVSVDGPALLETATAGAVELWVDEGAIGWLAPDAVTESVRLATLLPSEVPAEPQWHGISAVAADGRVFGIVQPTQKHRGAHAWVRDVDGGLELVFLNTVQPGLPDHVARLAAAPVQRFGPLEKLAVHTHAPAPVAADGEAFVVVGLDGQRLSVSNAVLAGLPVHPDPERPEKPEGNWHVLGDLLDGLGLSTGGLVVVPSNGPAIELTADALGLSTVMFKRNKKDELRLRICVRSEGDARATRMHDVQHLAELRLVP